MAKPKGSKNITTDQEVVDTDQISEDTNLVTEQSGDKYLNDHMIPKKKVLIGYHPISGAEVWQ
jgi:hypothetical protein